MMMRTTQLTAACAALSLTGLTSAAGITDWQNDAIAQGAGFTQTGIASPTAVNIGSFDETSNGGVSYVLVYNAQDDGGQSYSLTGVFDSVNTDGDDGAYKLEQNNNTGMFGSTEFGVADNTSTTASVYGADTHLAFINNGTTTDLYINGSFVENIAGAIELTGLIGIGGTWNVDANAFGDPISGEVLGFAAFDRALTALEVADSNAAFVPEPGSLALLGLGGLALIRRRRA